MVRLVERSLLEDVCFAASFLDAFLLLLGQLCDMAVHGVLVVNHQRVPESEIRR